MGRRTKLHLASNLSFGTEVITEVINIIAKRGSGKTYTGTKLAEEMLSIGAHTVVIDPVGNWYGLRLGSDGKPAGGMDITILGGRNGDIPLEHTAGKLIAQTLVETGMSVILDLSMFSKVKQMRFVTEFSTALLECRQKDPGAMHIFWEEAYRFMPQKMTKGSKSDMLEATEELITMGRNFGIGGTIICQRAAMVSKTVLSQASILIAMNTNAPGDRKVITEWMASQELTQDLADLSKLKKGEARVWWPEEFGIKEVQIDKKNTYNASATPKFGEKTRKRSLRPIDLGALQVAMSETIEKVKGNDPRLLKKRITQLEKELHDALARPTKTVEVPAVSEKDIKRFEEAAESLSKVSQSVLAALSVQDLANSAAKRPIPPRRTAFLKPPKPVVLSRPLIERPVSNGEVKINKGGVRMLKALAAVSPGGITKKQVALAAKLKSTSGTFGTYWSALNVAGFIQKDSGGKCFITQEGMEYLGDDIPTQPDTPEEKVEFWCERLSGKAKEMLKVLFEQQDCIFTKAELADAVGLSHTSGTFGTYLSSLTSNNLAVRESGHYTISPDLMA